MKVRYFINIVALIVIFPVILNGCDGNQAEDIEKITTSSEQEVIRDISAYQGENSLNQGVVCYKAGNIPKAIAALEQYVLYHSQNSMGQYYLGKAYFANNMFDKAIVHLGKAVNLDDEISDSYYYLGKSYQSLNNKQKAIENLYKYISLNPNILNKVKIEDEINNLSSPVIGIDIIGRIFTTDQVIKDKNIAVDSKSLFLQETDTIYASLEIINPKYNSIIYAEWSYLSPVSDKVQVNTIQFTVSSSKNAVLSLKKPLTGWPSGQYLLEIYVNRIKNSEIKFYIL
jgi:tetratricopeptide (TPR) repeat protein